MARGKYISDFEREIIKIGVHHGYKAPAIARYLGREKMTVYNHIKAMQAKGMMGGLPFDFLQEQICKGIDASEAEHAQR